MKQATALALRLALPVALSAQENGPGLVVPVPSAAAVILTVDSFTTPTGARRELQIVRPRATGETAIPVVIFVNNGGPGLMRARSYQEWARLVTTRQLAGVLYEGSPFDPQQSMEASIGAAVAHLDSVVAALQRRRATLHIDPSTLVVWAGSGMTWSGTPFALSGTRPINGYVLYYGAGNVTQPRIDVPVLMVRAGLDAPGLNASFDSLARRLTAAGSPVTVLSHPAGTHGFDLNDSTATSASVIGQTLDFMQRVTTPALHSAILAEVPEAAAGAALAAERWAEAERAYLVVSERKPANRAVAWKLGMAQLGNGHPAEALASFDRAKALGQGGARDIGVPAIRAALRSGNEAKAAEWAIWALRAYPRIRDEIAADRELAPVLALPAVRAP